MNKKWLAVFLLLVVALVGVLAACGEDFCKVEFIVDGNVIQSSTGRSGEELHMPPNPTKEGYTFEGWYFDENLEGEQLTKDYFVTRKPKDDIIVYAKWKAVTAEDNPSQYTITFNSNGGDDVDDITLAAGENVAVPNSPTRAGYTFDGWYTDNGTYEDAYIFTVMSEENIVLYAKWTSNASLTTTELRFDTDDTFEVDALNSIKYSFEVDEFRVLQLSLWADSAFNAVLSGGGKEKSYQGDRVYDSLLLESGEYSLVVSKHETDIAITTNIAYQEIATNGEVRLDEEFTMCMAEFAVSEQRSYTLTLNPHTDDILFDIYDNEGIKLAENQEVGAVGEYQEGNYYLLFYNASDYTGQASLTTATDAPNISLETAEPLNDLTKTGLIDVKGVALYYSFTVDTNGTLIAVNARAEHKKHIVVAVMNDSGEIVKRAGFDFTSNLASLPDYDNEAKGEYVLAAGTYYLRVNLSQNETGAFEISAKTPNIINTSLGNTHSLYITPNTTYYFKVFVEANSYINFKAYKEDNPNSYYPLYQATREENGITYYSRAYTAAMFTGDNHYGTNATMIIGGSAGDSTDIISRSVAEQFSDKADIYYICLRVYQSAEGGNIVLKVESE